MTPVGKTGDRGTCRATAFFRSVPLRRDPDQTAEVIMSEFLERTQLNPVTNLLFDSLEKGDVDTYIGAHAENCYGAVGNAEPVHSREDIRGALEQMYTVVSKITHHVVNEWVSGHDTVVEAKAEYERRDGKTVTLPSVTIYTLGEGNLITSVRIYVDYAPLFAA
jgi:ketosteroid isomerase-like protein